MHLEIVSLISPTVIHGKLEKHWKKEALWMFKIKPIKNVTGLKMIHFKMSMGLIQIHRKVTKLMGKCYQQQELNQAVNPAMLPLE